MALDLLIGSAPFRGDKPAPIGTLNSGMLGGFRLQEAAVTGAAVSRSATNTTAALLDIYLYGNSSARSEFFGVIATDGAAPQMALAITANNDECVNVITDGYCKVLLGAGQVVRKGQWMEPIPNGSGHFRPVTAGGHGVAKADSDADNSGGATAIYVGADLRQAQAGSGLVGAITASSTALSATAETAFSQSVVLAAAATLRAGDVFRVRAKARVTVGAAADTLVIRLRLNTAAGVLLAASPSIDPAADALYLLDVTLTLRSVGAGGTLTSAGLALAATSAAAAGTAGTVAIDTTVANTIVATADWSADTTDAVVLEDLVVEKIN